jgi:hypothetical protein
MLPLSQLNKISTDIQPTFHDQNDEIKAEFGRLLHAAVINKHFQEKLLDNPINCIETGYCGESFHFPFELKSCIKQINAKSLEEFANQVIKLINMPIRREVAAVFCN